MGLVSRFSKNAVSVGNLHEFLDEDTLRAFTPSVFAPHAHPDRSEKYNYIPTIDVLRGLANEGFRPVFAAQASPRRADKKGFTKHLVRFRRESDVTARSTECPEIIMLNSHGGESKLQLLQGVFRFVCLNSQVAGDTYEDVRIRHNGKMIEDAVEAAFRLAKGFEGLMGAIDSWKQVRLTADDQLGYARSAMVLRLGEQEEGKAKREVEADEFLEAVRVEDGGDDLWTVASRVQEHAIRGGVRQTLVSANGRKRRMTTRPVNGIDQNTSLNRALWMLTEHMAKLKAA